MLGRARAEVARGRHDVDPGRIEELDQFAVRLTARAHRGDAEFLFAAGKEVVQRSIGRIGRGENRLDARARVAVALEQVGAGPDEAAAGAAEIGLDVYHEVAG